MKKLTLGLVGVGALAIPLGASLALPATAFAGITAGQGAQKVYLVENPTSQNILTGPTGGTPSTTSWVNNVLDATTGNLTTTIHLEGAAPNVMYVGYVYDQDGLFVHSNTVLIFTNGQGNGTAVDVNHYPTATQAVVQVNDFRGSSFESPVTPVSPS
jgi:hypothetical protein